MCFSGRKTREERNVWLKVSLFGFPDVLVNRSAPMDVMQRLTCWSHPQLWLVHLNLVTRWHTKGSRGSCCQRVTGLKWTNQSWGWTQLLIYALTAVNVDLLISTSGEPKRLTLSQTFRSSGVFRPSKHTYLKWNLLGFMELLVLLRLGTFPFEERAICGVTSG